MLTPVEPGAELVAALAATEAEQLRGALRSRPALLLTPARRELLLALVQQLANKDRLVRQQASKLKVEQHHLIPKCTGTVLIVKASRPKRINKEELKIGPLVEHKYRERWKITST